MALSPSEQAELDALEKEAATLNQSQPTYGLTPQEQAELDQLEKEAQAHAQTSQAPAENAMEAFIQHAGNGASFGYLPQIQALTEPAIQTVTDLFLPKDPEGFQIEQSPSKTYTERRDSYLRDQERMAKDHQLASLAGGATGAIASAVATGGGLGKVLGMGVKAVPAIASTEAGAALINGTRAATTLGRLGQAGATGGLVGLIRNPGDTEGEISPLQLGDRAQNAATDAITAMLFQGGTEAVGKIGGALKNSAKTAKEFAETRSLKASGAMKADMKLLRKLGIKGDIGRAALEEGVVTAGDDISSVAEKVVDKKNDVGKQIGNIYKTAKDELRKNPHLDSEIDLHQTLDQFETDLVSRHKGKTEGRKVVAAIKEKIDSLRENPEKIDLETLHQIRQDVDKAAKKAKAWGIGQDTDVADELKKLRNILQDAGENKISDVDQALGTNFVKDLAKESKRYSNLKQLEKITKDGLSRDESNRIYGLSEQLATMGGTVAKGPVVGVGLGIGSRLVKKYGDSNAASIANSLYKTLNNNPRALGVFADPLIKAASISPQRFSFALNNMMKKPEFKKKLEELQIQEMNTMPALGGENRSSGREPSGR